MEEKASVGIEKSSALAEGNTETSAKSKKQPCRRKFYCFTLFNYEGIENTVKHFLEEKCCKWTVGYEVCPSTGRPHLQGFFELKKTARISELQGKGIVWSRLEACLGSEEQNKDYCTKEGKIFSQFPKPRRPLKIITDLRPFQLDLEKRLLEEPDDRKIIWVNDEIGQTGKSQFCKYLIHRYDALYLTEGKKNDLVNLVYNYILNKDLDIVILDVPRDNTTISYKTLEEIKNGMICNTKFETGSKIINSPHIIVFANFYPKLKKYTKDRWEIYTINEDLELIDITPS